MTSDEAKRELGKFRDNIITSAVRKNRLLTPAEAQLFDVIELALQEFDKQQMTHD